MAPDPCRYLDHFTGLNLHEQHEAVKMGGFFGIGFSVQYTIYHNLFNLQFLALYIVHNLI